MPSTAPWCRRSTCRRICIREVPQAAQVRLHAVRQSDPRSAGRRVGGSRGRRRRGGDLHGALGHHLDSRHTAEPRAGHRALRLLRRHLSPAQPRLHAQGNLVVEFIDQGDAAALAAALAQGAHLLWIETPSNPLLRIVDIRAMPTQRRAARRPVGGRQHLSFARLAAAAGARRRHGRALDHQVPQWSQRRGRWGGDRARPRSCRRNSRGGPTASASPVRRSTAS